MKMTAEQYTAHQAKHGRQLVRRMAKPMPEKSGNVAKTKPEQSKGEALFLFQCKAHGLEPAMEHRYAWPRRYRFDFAWPDIKLAVEIDGGNRLAVIGKNGKPYAVGRHTQADDYAKLNLAIKLGWRVLRFTPAMVTSGEAISDLLEVLA